MKSTTCLFNRVTVLGACGGIGQSLSLLLKRTPLISHLSLYDVTDATGVAADLSHISTPALVKGYAKDQLDECLKNSEIVLIPAGVPRKPGMTRDDLFSLNAGIIHDLTESIAKQCPGAIIGVITNPVNSTVPIAVEVLKKYGCFNPKKVIGITTLDIVRAKTFCAISRDMNPFDINPSVIGGHSGATIVPILSSLGMRFTQKEVETITHRIQYGGDEVVAAKAGKGSATLSMAYAAAEFTTSLLKAMRGDQGVVECAFVHSDIQPGLSYFSSKCELGPEGIHQVHPIGEITKYEQTLIDTCVKELAVSIKKGEDFVLRK